MGDHGLSANKPEILTSNPCRQQYPNLYNESCSCLADRAKTSHDVSWLDLNPSLDSFQERTWKLWLNDFHSLCSSEKSCPSSIQKK